MAYGSGVWSGSHQCYFCGKRMSSRGFAVAAHNRMHVRRGEAVELRNDTTWDYDWVKPEEVERFTRSGHYTVVRPTPRTDA